MVKFVVRLDPSEEESVEARESREAQEELNQLIGGALGADPSDKTAKSLSEEEVLPIRQPSWGSAPRREDDQQSNRSVRGQSTGRRSSAPLKVKLGGVKFGNLKPIPTDPTVDPPPYACFNCWGWGHSVFECEAPQTDAYCYNCGRRGVDMINCPRCGDRHQEFLDSRGQGRPHSKPRSQSVSTAKPKEESQTTKPPQARGHGSRSDSQTVRWASPLVDSLVRKELEPEVREELETDVRRRVESPSPPRRNKSQSAARRSSRALPYEDQSRREGERANTSSSSSASEPEEASEGVAGAISDTLRLMEELRGLPTDIRDAILRQTFCDSTRRASRSRTRREHERS